MIRHGTPNATTLAGRSCVTTLPAPTTVLSPIVIPGMILTFDPIHTFHPIWMPTHVKNCIPPDVKKSLPSDGKISLPPTLSALSMGGRGKRPCGAEAISGGEESESTGRSGPAG